MYVKKEFPYPCFDRDTHEGDLKLLQVCPFDSLRSHRTSYNGAACMGTSSLALVATDNSSIMGVLEGWARIEVKIGPFK